MTDPQALLAPTLSAAHQRLAAVRASGYARTRNHLAGDVTRLSPYLTHGLLSLPEVAAQVHQRSRLEPQHKLVMELGWREYFHHVWAYRGATIFSDLHAGPLPRAAYATELPADIRGARTGVPVIDQAVRELYATGYLHNHARMWLASYVVHLRRVHWRVGADWMYAHLLDGDLASNHLSWQWVAGTGSHKPYLFNAENVAKYAPPDWHSPGTVVDTTYDALGEVAAGGPLPVPTVHQARQAAATAPTPEPATLTSPPAWLSRELGFAAPAPLEVSAGATVWLAHPWNLGEPLKQAFAGGEPPAADAQGATVVAVFVTDFHEQWPWSEPRWRFVAERMAAMTPHRWVGNRAEIMRALSAMRAASGVTVQTADNLHLRHAMGLPFGGPGAGPARGDTKPLVQAMPEPRLTALPKRLYPSFFAYWSAQTKGAKSLADLPGVAAFLPQLSGLYA
jgi:deoxyribodipyrimidine photo-lyase